MKKSEFTYEVVEKIAVISQNGANTLELRKVSYNGAEAKLDLRRWYTDDKGTEKMGKGLTLSKQELESLAAVVVQDYVDTHKDEDAKAKKSTGTKRKSTSTAKKSTTSKARTTKATANKNVIPMPFK